MNKQEYTIGRDNTCHVCIPDTPQTQKASRLHAILKVMSNGKIFITDCSSNGTSVNGVKIAPNIDYPVKRGDVISFANVTELNWESIPKPRRKKLLYLVAAVLVLGTGLAVFFLLYDCPAPPLPEPVLPGRDTVIIENPCPEDTPADTVDKKSKDKPAKKKPERNPVVRDTTATRQDDPATTPQDDPSATQRDTASKIKMYVY